MTAMTPEQAKAEAMAKFADTGPDHINCSQAVLHFALRLAGSDLDLVTAARYFGGGIAGKGEACGAVSGAALALGLRDLDSPPEDHNVIDRTRGELQGLVGAFAEKFGGCRCRDLTGYDLSTEEGHKAFMESEIRLRCQDYVGWMCDQLAPMVAGRD